MEGGVIFFNKNQLELKNLLFNYTNFGDRIRFGSNLKMSELNAAWGLMQLRSFKQRYDYRMFLSNQVKNILHKSFEGVFNVINGPQTVCVYDFSKKNNKLLKDISKKMLELGVQTREYYDINGLCFPVWNMDPLISEDYFNRIKEMCNEF